MFVSSNFQGGKTPRFVNFIGTTSVWNMRPKLHQTSAKSTSIVIWDLLIIKVDATACRHAMKLFTITKLSIMILLLTMNMVSCFQICCKDIMNERRIQIHFLNLCFFRTINGVTMNFKGNEFITILRSEQFGFIDFISSCGGLMGLFLGVSLFSVFEIIYFCVFQLFFRLCHRDEI